MRWTRSYPTTRRRLRNGLYSVRTHRKRDHGMWTIYRNRRYVVPRFISKLIK